MSLHAQWHRLFTFGSVSALAIGLTAGSPAHAQDPQDIPRPVITSVSSIVPRGTQTIVIHGLGFGHADPFNGKSIYIRVTDITQRNWIAGWNNFNVGTSPLIVSRWTDTEIVIDGFPDYGTPDGAGGKRLFEVGDVVKIEVANPKIPQGLPSTNPDDHSRPEGAFSVRVTASATAPPAPEPPVPGPAPSALGADPCTGCVVSLSIAPSMVVPGGAASVFGIVEDGSGKPAPSATVEVSALVGGQLVPPATVTTHADGTFSVPFTAPHSAGTVTFHARMANAPRAASVITTLKVVPN
jgi:hypothetical protein